MNAENSVDCCTAQYVWFSPTVGGRCHQPGVLTLDDHRNYCSTLERQLFAQPLKTTELQCSHCNGTKRLSWASFRADAQNISAGNQPSQRTMHEYMVYIALRPLYFFFAVIILFRSFAWAQWRSHKFAKHDPLRKHERISTTQRWLRRLCLFLHSLCRSFNLFHFFVFALHALLIYSTSFQRSALASSATSSSEWNEEWRLGHNTQKSASNILRVTVVFITHSEIHCTREQKKCQNKYLRNNNRTKNSCLI